MDCQDCQSLLPEFVLDLLAEGDRERVTHHLAGGCVHCQRSLREAGQTWVRLADALPPAAVPSRVDAALRSRMAQRGATSPNGQPRTAFSPESDELAMSDRRSFSRIAWSLAATVLVATTIGGLAWLNYSRGKMEALQQEAAQRAREMQRLQSEIAQANELFRDDRLHFASLREAAPGSPPRGYVVWDRITRQVHFYVFDLPSLPDGRAWHIWLLGEGTDPIPAGVLDARGNRAGSVLIDVPPELGDRFRVAVVEGPQSTPPKPVADPWLTTEVE